MGVGRGCGHGGRGWTGGSLAVLSYGFAGSARGLPSFRAAGRQFHRRALFPQKHGSAMAPAVPDLSRSTPLARTPDIERLLVKLRKGLALRDANNRPLR